MGVVQENNFKLVIHTGHILIITVDSIMGLTSNLVKCDSCPSSIDCMHWSLKQSQIQHQRQKMQDKDY